MRLTVLLWWAQAREVQGQSSNRGAAVEQDRRIGLGVSGHAVWCGDGLEVWEWGMEEHRRRIQGSLG